MVQALIDAGAIALGKTNLDQFATGLVGTRSPYGICGNAFDPAFISGGSSSGSAVAVALGLASFSLGTDTAGSGRVPAAFNNLVGYKPTLGTVSIRGVVPACRSLDVVSVFALTAEDLLRVREVVAKFDPADAAARQPGMAPRAGFGRAPSFRFAVPIPAQREFFGNAEYARLFDASIERLRGLGGEAVEVDITPLLAAARLLYEGPWVAERYLATESLITNPGAMLEVTRRIIEAGAAPRALDSFRAQYRLKELIREARPIWASADVLLLPTAGTHFRIAEIEAEPIALNSRLGTYTNFVNLMDLAAVAVPAGFTSARLPFGVSLIAPAWSDPDLLALAGAYAARRGQHPGRHVAAAATRRSRTRGTRGFRRRDGVRRSHVGPAIEQATAGTRCLAVGGHAHGAYLPLLRAARRAAVPSRAGAGQGRRRGNRRRGVAHAHGTLRVLRGRHSRAARHRQGEAGGRQPGVRFPVRVTGSRGRR